MRIAAALCLLGALVAASARESQRIQRVTAAELPALASPAATLYATGDDGRTLVLDFPSLAHQGRTMARIVLFIERDGAPRDAVMTQDEVARYLQAHRYRRETLTYGNNFRASQLALFFNTARARQEPLAADEQWLHDALVDAGALRMDAQGATATEPERVLVTIPQVSEVAGCTACTVTMAIRAAILEHELAHARFATDDAYRRRVLECWNGMDDDMRERFTQFLRRRGYDPGNASLLADEMQAFLLHTPDQAMFNAKALGVDDARLQALRRQLRND